MRSKSQDNPKWRSTSILTKHYDRIEAVSDKLGQPVTFYVNEALDNYMEDVFSGWETKVVELVEEIRAGRRRR